eukprot:5252089-Prymnesium_polylepis.2
MSADASCPRACSSTSGAIQQGEPTNVCRLERRSPPSKSVPEKPKSVAVDRALRVQVVEPAHDLAQDRKHGRLVEAARSRVAHHIGARAGRVELHDEPELATRDEGGVQLSEILVRELRHPLHLRLHAAEAERVLLLEVDNLHGGLCIVGGGARDAHVRAARVGGADGVAERVLLVGGGPAGAHRARAPLWGERAALLHL